MSIQRIVSAGRGVLFALATLAATFAGRFASAEQAPIPLTHFPQAQLAIRTVSGNVHQFKIWIAQDPSHQEQGLMFVNTLEDHAGMLFVYPHDQRIAMWMKNTLIPLDMLFLAADGHVVYVAENAVPQSLDIISTPTPVRSVLEIKGSMAKRLGVKAGDVVTSTALETAKTPHSPE